MGAYECASSYGIFDMIIASIYVTAGAIIIGVPIGILTAVFLARFCPAPLYKVLKPATELFGRHPVNCLRLLRTYGSCTVHP